MHARLADLYRSVAQQRTAIGQLAALRGAFEGEDGFLFSCGPSLRDVPSSIEGVLRGRCVIAVKQAYIPVGESVDFHLLNSTSAQRYEYGARPPIVIFERGVADARVWGIRPDIALTVTGTDPAIPRRDRLRRRLAITENYDDFLFEMTPDRPWGPGVILEIGIYLAVHVGLRRLYVAGWDLGPPSVSLYDHFYGQAGRLERGKLGLLTRRVVRRWPFTWLQWLRYRAGRIYNLGTVEPDDTAVSVQSSFGMSEWLRGRGVELVLVSRVSHLDQRIRRASWKEVLAELGQG